MRLSIIIPVYKVEKYIDGTLSSIYSQNANEELFEVIVVNDGTPDNSMEIVKKFSACHSNLTIINQQNQGLSVARNEGLKIARGRYVWFVDSDDTITDKSLLKLLRIVEKEDVDILGFDLTRLNEDGSIISEESPFVKTKYKSLYNKKCLGKYLYHKIHIGIVQRYVCRRVFLLDKSLTFYPGIWYEDDQFSVRAFYLAESVKIINMNIYRYLVRKSGNIMSSVSMKSIYDSEKLIRSWLNFIKEHNLNNKDKTIFYDAISNYCFFIFSFQKYGELEYEDFIAKHGKYYRNLGLRSAIKSFKYHSRRKVLCFMALLFSPNLIKKIY